MLTICTWLWGDKYGQEDVDRLARGVWRNLKQVYCMLVVTDRCLPVSELYTSIQIPQQDRYLLQERGCFVRLRMFDPEWQDDNLLDRIVCMDLDSVITGPLDPLFTRPENFVILQGANAANPCPFNGSLMMLRAGAHPEVWSDFSLDAAGKVPFYEFPDDQGWLHHKIPNAAGWQVGERSGVYAFQKPGWPKGEALPKDARMVVFPGWRAPEKFKQLGWIKENWI
jgi:hypothetical protein